MKRVLIVEDNPDILSAMEYLIRAEGYETVICPDGHSAKALLSNPEAEPFLCVVLDNIMPGLSGQELIEWIVSPAFPLPSAPPIVLTTTNPRQVKLEGLTTPVVVVPKPLGVEDLLRTIESFARATQK